MSLIDRPAPYLTDYERRHLTPRTQGALMFVRTLPDDRLLTIARDQGGAEHRRAMAVIGQDTNPSWLTARCAETAYERKLIDEVELDYICR